MGAGLCTEAKALSTRTLEAANKPARPPHMRVCLDRCRSLHLLAHLNLLHSSRYSCTNEYWQVQLVAVADTWDQMGMDGEESNHERSPERETAESTRCSDAGGDTGISQGTA